MAKAARLSDPIGHSPSMSWLVKGLLIGAAVAVAGVAIVGTGGLAAAAIIGGAAAGGAGIGELMSAMSWAPKEIAGAILGACSANVFTNNKPAARAHLDLVACDKHSGSPPIASGSDNVFINDQPAARVGDKTGCGGEITDGSGDVFIGGGTTQTDAIHPEALVPGWVHATLLVVGGGFGGGWLGGRLWGEGSDGQKWAMLGGSLVGGALGAKGGVWFDKNYAIMTEGLGANFGNLRIKARGTSENQPATFGRSDSADYKKTFFEAYPELKGNVVVHHAVEQQVQTRYPGLVSDSEMHSLENLRGIPLEENSDMHLSGIRKEWNRFYRENADPSKQKLLDKATEIDDIFGARFNPQIRE